MTLVEITQLLGGIGAIGSLIYVGIQIRNNSRAVRAANYQHLSTYFRKAGTALDMMAVNTRPTMTPLENDLIPCFE